MTATPGLGVLTSEQWERAKAIFHEALDRSPHERAPYLDGACAGDATMRREVESLLAAHDAPGRFLDRPLVDLNGSAARSDAAWAGALDGDSAKGGAHPDRVGRYRIEREIGRGGMGIVYLAHDEQLDGAVAVKMIRGEIADRVNLERFMREARVTAAWEHAHILRVLDVGEADGRPYFVTPWVAGESLAQRLARERQLPLDDALRITAQVAEALAYAHTRGVLHRDVKPANILLMGEHSYLADFGIARAVAEADDDRLTATGAMIGTPAYVSPEQAAGDRTIDVRSDLYSLASLTYEMLAGQPPFTGPDAQSVVAQKMAHAPQSVRRLRPSVPEHVDRALLRALQPVRADRFTGVDAFGAALTDSGVRRRREWDPRVRPSSAAWWRTPAARIAGVAALATAVAAVLVARTYVGTPAALDANLVAVAPFDVAGPDTLWREGLVDALSRGFDGAGALHTVAPATLVKGWRGRADAGSAGRLAREIGAGLAVFGDLRFVGRDSARLSASLLDVDAGAVISRVVVDDEALRVGRAADSVAAHLLRDLGAQRHTARVTPSAMGTRSAAALRRFLEGEQFFRANDWGAAEMLYRQALTADPAFALALHRMRSVLRGNRYEFDSLSFAYALRAAALNRGLGTRDSLFILADSLYAAAELSPTSPARWARQKRRLQVLTQAAARYPKDPEAWMELGEAQYHFGDFFGLDDRETLRSFERAASLDPGFAPPYVHLVALTLKYARPESAVRIVRRYPRVTPPDGAFQLTDALLTGGAVDRRAGFVSAALRRASARDLNRATFLLSSVADSAEVLAQVYRELDARLQVPGVAIVDSTTVVHQRARVAAMRGHLREAYALARGSLAEWDPAAFALLARQGVVAPEVAALTFARWLRLGDYARAKYALPWWAGVGDTSSIVRLIGAAGGRAERADVMDSTGTAAYTGAAARAYLALARRDSAAAESLFAALPDTLCGGRCIVDQLERARLLGQRDRWRDAAVVLELHPPSLDRPSAFEGLWLLERAQAALALGDDALARQAIHRTDALWRAADAPARRRVLELRRRLR